MDKVPEIYEALWHKTNFNQFYLNTYDPIIGWKG